MASGDLTASVAISVRMNATTNFKTVIDSLNLSAVTDTLHIVPIPGKDNVFWVFKVEREA